MTMVTESMSAGGYFVMGELLAKGFDAQLADRNTKGYDILVGSIEADYLEKVQIKTVRSPPWHVTATDFNEYVNRITIYVLLGPQIADKPARFFIVRNELLKRHVKYSESLEGHGLLPLAAVAPHEGCWNVLPGYPSAANRIR